GGDLPLAALLLWSDGSAQDISTSVSWTSADSGTVSVGPSTGVAHGAAAGGPIQITATDSGDGYSATASISVGAPVLRSVAIVPDEIGLVAGDTLQLHASGLLSDGTSIGE